MPSLPFFLSWNVTPREVKSMTSSLGAVLCLPPVTPSASFVSWWKEVTHRHVTGYSRASAKCIVNTSSCLFRSVRSQSGMVTLGAVCVHPPPPFFSFHPACSFEFHPPMYAYVLARFRVAVIRPWELTSKGWSSNRANKCFVTSSTISFP